MRSLQVSSALVFVLLCACGGGSDGGSAPAGSSGSGGSGTGGAITAGAGGTSAAAGKGGSGTAGTGAAGASAGSAGEAGTSGGSGGSGTSGKGGAAGSSGAAGSGGCTVAKDCPLPATSPASCALVACETGQCVLHAVDGDGDGHGTKKCVATDGTPVVLGDDCDDSDKSVHPGAWDGPAGGGLPDRCDGIDQDCSGKPDDEKGADGTTCTCTPGDVAACATDPGGQPVEFPLGMPVGACKMGKRTCDNSGAFGPCIGTVGPKTETCNKADDDCNGIVDDDPIDRIPWTYDGDDDLHGGAKESGYALVLSCSFDVPQDPPLACTKQPLPCALGATLDLCCPKGAWKPATTIPSDDCDDRDKKISPVSVEVCGNQRDDNCNTKIDEGCVCPPGMTTACSEKSTGAAITWPTGAPVGTCQYGSKQCADDGKSYGPCIGAVAPAAKDACLQKGTDDDCNGVPDQGCACTSGDTQPCGSSKGSCQQGTVTCQANGQWAATCVGAILPKANDTCEPGNDDNCNGIPNEGCNCTSGTTTSCGAAATCNATATKTCVSGQYAPCTTPPVQNVGADCTAAIAASKGACVDGGTVACADDPTDVDGKAACNAKKGVGQSTWAKAAAPWNGSWDWNCDGVVEKEYTSDPSGACNGNCDNSWNFFQTGACGSTGSLLTCGLKVINGQAVCTAKPYPLIMGCH